MNRAEAIPVDGSRSTTEPPSVRAPAAPPPALGEASPSQVTTPVHAAGGNDLVVRPAVRLRPPAPTLPPHQSRAAAVTHRGRPDGTPDRLPVRRDGPAVLADQRATVRDQQGGLPAETRTGSGSVTRRTGRGRGPLAARRVVGL